jgi:hypothetical protein
LLRELSKDVDVSESIIRLTLHRHGDNINSRNTVFKNIQHELKLLVQFLTTHFYNNLFEKLSSKVSLVSDNTELLKDYLNKWQQVLNNKFRKVKLEDQIEFLFTQ